MMLWVGVDDKHEVTHSVETCWVIVFYSVWYFQLFFYSFTSLRPKTNENTFPALMECACLWDKVYYYKTSLWTPSYSETVRTRPWTCDSTHKSPSGPQSGCLVTLCRCLLFLPQSPATHPLNGSPPPSRLTFSLSSAPSRHSARCSTAVEGLSERRHV